MAIVDLIVDLGSSYTTIYKKGEGIVLHEPTLLLISGKSIENGKIIEFGQKARDLVGKLPKGSQLLYPIQEGAIAYKKATSLMLTHFISKCVRRADYFFKPKVRVFLNIPCGSLLEERHLIEDLLNSIGIQEVYLIESPIFASFGTNTPITHNNPLFIADIGGGTTDVALITPDGIEIGYSFGIGGMAMDRGIVDGLQATMNTQLGIVTAEELKKEIGSLFPNEKAEFSVFGKNTITSNPRPIVVTSKNIYPMLEYFYSKIVTVISNVLKELSVDTLDYIFENGIVLTGGGAKLPGLKEYMKKELKIPVKVCFQPEFATANGGARLLDMPEDLNRILKIT